jgi:transposase
MTNILNMTERDRILGMYRQGWSVRCIARETGHWRETIARYVREAGLSKPNRATPIKVPTDPAVVHTPEIVKEEPPSSTAIDHNDARTTRSRCEEHRPFITAELDKGRNAKAIYQDLVEHYGYNGAYDSVKRFAGKYRTSEPKISCRFETPVGQEVQVDYGEGAPTLDPRTGKYRKPRLFVMTLGMSRHMFIAVVRNSSSQTWCELHEAGFAFFGGSAKMVRLDNLREGVIKPDIYDPELNALYADVLRYYNVIAFPCRPYAPDLKGKVESGVGYVQKTALKTKRFESIEEQNTFLQQWNQRWAMTRIHGTMKRQVGEMFEEERPFLQALPTSRFTYYRILERRVHFDGHIEVDGAYYSAPPRYAGCRIIVHAGILWVRLIDPQTHQVVYEHTTTRKGSRRTHDAHRPKQTPPQVHQLVKSVSRFGESCAIFARALENEHGALAARSLFGVLHMARKHGSEALERACSMAVTARVWKTRFLRVYLEKHAPAKPLIEKNPIITNIDTYVTHLKALTQGELFNESHGFEVEKTASPDSAIYQ